MKVNLIGFAESVSQLCGSETCVQTSDAFRLEHGSLQRWTLSWIRMSGSGYCLRVSEFPSINVHDRPVWLQLTNDERCAVSVARHGWPCCA